MTEDSTTTADPAAAADWALLAREGPAASTSLAERRAWILYTVACQMQGFPYRRGDHP